MEHGRDEATRGCEEAQERECLRVCVWDSDPILTIWWCGELKCNGGKQPSVKVCDGTGSSRWHGCTVHERV